MIYTITPNPALDLSGEVKELVPNEKMYVEKEARHPGGNGINAARVMHALGVPVCATGFLGGGTGAEIRDLLEKEGMKTRFIPIKGHTRTNVTVWNRKTRRQTRLSFPGPEIRQAEAGKLSALLGKASSDSLFVVGGSLPPGLGLEWMKSILRLSRRKGIPCMVDVPSRFLKPLVQEHPAFIKPNLREFREFTGRYLESKAEVLKAARKWSAKIPMICVSSVEKGALLVTPEGAWWGIGPKVKIRSHVGAGDSMVGAMGARVWKSGGKAGGEELLRWGLAAAVGTLSSPGTQLADKALIKKYLGRIRIERLN